MIAKISSGELAGTEFEVSEETINNLKVVQEEKRAEEDEENAPVFSVIDERLIVKLTPRLLKTIGDYVGKYGTTKYISFCPNGFIGTEKMGDTWKKASTFYGLPKPKSIFGKE